MRHVPCAGDFAVWFHEENCVDIELEGLIEARASQELRRNEHVNVSDCPGYEAKLSRWPTGKRATFCVEVSQLRIYQKYFQLSAEQMLKIKLETIH